MASSTSALDQRVGPHLSHGHVNQTVMAMQGATTAFHAGTTRSRSPAVTHRTGEATDVNKRGLGSGLPPEIESEVPPEVGSVKEKIGRYTAHSQNAFESARKSSAMFRPQPPQQLAARLAAEHSSPSERNTTTAPDSGTIRGANEPPSKDKNDVQSLRLSASTSIESIFAKDKPLDLSSQGNGSVPIQNLSIRRKPTMQPSDTPPETTRPAATKPRPIPPVPRKTRPVASGAVSAAPAPRNVQSNEPKDFYEPLSSRSSVRSKSSSILPNGKAPALPPRPGRSSAPKDGLNNHRALLGKNEFPRRPLSPSASSIYGQPHNSSSSSLHGDSTGLSEDALSDAIVASSLASSRAPPTREGPPPPLPQRRARPHSILQLNTNRREHSQSPSPPSSLRHTLRNPAKSDDADDVHRRYRTHTMRKHLHKHHEGDRKRWRSELTEKERKRYEGVWAANKGHLVPTQEEVNRQCLKDDPLRDKWPPNATEMVVNIVVRDIWSRSRLDPFVLEQIWNLVDTQNIGLLTREEFVVGMWLIDEQLRGHKLPAKVPDSVWASVKRVPGASLLDIDFHS
ncbi:hypothetical protein BDV28DRAFT_134090 [Aspergillus coremiiformis]|uniref:EH domain-containing protein n=1 Tax=Aspergillus coremiiformis TaxID=138285 RepID=A0A5N6Z5S4_9EURO|nr:hypothetical protein BDV28DRAFT_134090 [Aspergillus coremiiformis]